MTISPVLLVPVDFVNSGSGLGPVRLPGVPGLNILRQASDQRTGRKKRQPEIEQDVDIRFNERLGLHHGKELSRQHRFTVMADAGRLPCQIEREMRIARGNHRPGVNKDLRANLFGHRFSIQLDRTTSRRQHSLLETKKGGVFRRVAEASTRSFCSR